MDNEAREIAYTSVAHPQGDCLVAVLEDDITLFAATWPLTGFRVGPSVYCDTGQGELTGFYDWLRTTEGTVIGVRYWPSSGDDEFERAIGSLRYVESRKDRSVEIYFSGHRTYDALRSSDQAFMYDPVFRASPTRWGLAFDTSELTGADFTCLRVVSEVQRLS